MYQVMIYDPYKNRRQIIYYTDSLFKAREITNDLKAENWEAYYVTAR